MTITTGGSDSRVDSREDYERWRSELLRYVYRLTGDSDLAEDIAQDALVRFLAAGARRAVANPRAWLYRVATNLVRDQGRREAWFRRNFTPDSEPPVTPDRALDRKETVRAVRETLDQLPPRDRELLILRESGFKYREIAEVVGVKTESVPTLVMRALHRFRAGYTAEASS